jgi:hypothetical protein
MASTVAVWTEHENKTIHDGTSETSDTDCTMIMYRTIGSKYITGIYLPSLLLKNGSNFPQWNNGYQSITHGSGNTGFQTGAITNWTVKSTLQNSSPATNRILLAGTTGNKITTADYKSTLANFGNTSFSIGSGLQVATATGSLHANVASDKLSELTVNDFSSFVSSNEYDSSVLNNYKDESTTFVKSWTGSASKPNTFYIHNSNNGLSFNTTHWGTGAGNGIDLIDIGIFDGTKCVGTNASSATIQNLSNISWTDSAGKSTYVPTVTQSGGETADIFMPTSSDGYNVGNQASCYIRLNNSDLATDNSNVVAGYYILKATMSSNHSFVDGAATVDRGLTLANMGITWQASRQSAGDEAKGAKVKLLWKVNSSGNKVYQQTDATNLTNTSGTDKIIFTDNIRRLRTDGSGAGGGNLSQDVLYLGNGLGNAISILPEKIWTNTSNNIINDQYGLWFNASYTYYINAYNIVTGDIISNKTATILTKPGTPINWQEAQAYTIQDENPSIVTEWQNPLATGSGGTIIYSIARQSYSVSGTDVSDNSTVENGTFSSTTNANVSSTTETIGGVNVSIGGSYETGYGTNGSNGETLLYGKSFSYTLKANNGTNSDSTLTQSFTVPDESGSDISLNYTCDASQNTLGTIIQIKDFEDNTLSYEDNYIVINVPTDYTFSDSSPPTEWQIFEKYKLIATISKAKTDISGNDIILSNYWYNGNKTSITEKREEGIWLNVIAADPPNQKYSAVGITKYVKTLPKPLSPTPDPVTNINVTGGLNKNTISWNYAYGTTDSNDPSTYNYIDSIEIYAIINTGGTLDGGVYHYEHETDSTFDFGTGPAASNTISGSVYQLITTINNVSTTSFTTPANMWDNEIGAYRIVTKNVDGVYSGQDPLDPTTGIITWGTIQAASLETDTYTYDGTFASTYKQSKTDGPAPATGVTIGASAGDNNINYSWSATGIYSNDSPLAYSVSYVFNSVLGSGDLSPSNATLVPVPATDAAEGAVSTTASNNITNLVPGSQYTVTVSVYTNMQATRANNDNLWTVSAEGSKDHPYTTTENTVSTSNYALTGTDTNNNVASGFDIPVKVGHSVYQQEFSGSTLTWKHPQYNAFAWALSGGNSRTTPAHMVANWRNDSSAAGAPTKMTLKPSDVISGYSIQNGDIIAVFNVSNNYCLDNYTWNDGDDNTAKVLLCDKDATGNGGFMFQLWKVSEKTLHNLYVTQYDRDGTPGSGSLVTNDSNTINKIDGGPTDTVYANIQFAIADNKYKIFHKGKLVTTVTNILTYDATTLSDTEKNNYDITWYSDCTGVTSRSNVSSWTSNSESQTWTDSSVTGQLVELPSVITISNPVRSSVIYDANDSSNLVLGNSGTQTFSFNSGEWNYVSFSIVDTAKTQLRDLFGSITGLTASDSILMYDYLWNSYDYATNTWSGSPDIPLDYDQGYLLKIVTSDNTSRSLTVTGSQIRGINLQLSQGWNFMGHPYQQDETGAVVLANTDINNGSISFWNELIITYSPSGASLKGPKYSTIYGGTNTTGYSYGDSGTLTFEHGKMYVTRVAIQLILLIGTLQAIRNKGDFDGDNNIDIDDAYSLAKYLVQINPEFSNIASAITTEASSGNTDWANLKSTAGNNPDLRDLVHLISHIDNVTGYGSL